MESLKRNHDTKIPYIIDTEDGAKNGVLDLEKMSYEELVDNLLLIPEAINEIVYRDMLEYTKNTNK
jgi:hypothetical protein